MDNDSKISEGRTMPVDLAKNFDKGLYRNTVRPEDKLADALEEMTRDIVLVEPDPEDWDEWIVYLIEWLEGGQLPGISGIPSSNTSTI